MISMRLGVGGRTWGCEGTGGTCCDGRREKHKLMRRSFLIHRLIFSESARRAPLCVQRAPITPAARLRDSFETGGGFYDFRSIFEEYWAPRPHRHAGRAIAASLNCIASRNQHQPASFQFLTPCIPDMDQSHASAHLPSPAPRTPRHACRQLRPGCVSIGGKDACLENLSEVCRGQAD